MSAVPDPDRRPVLVGERVTLRPGGDGDVAVLREILREPSVTRWWRDPPPRESIAADPAAANAAAIRCYRSAGFHPVGVMREYERGAAGVWHDGLLMELLASDL